MGASPIMNQSKANLPSGVNEPHDPDVHRDPESRPAKDTSALKEKMLDKTLADSYPASDPPSSLPDPASEDSLLLDDEAA